MTLRKQQIQNNLDSILSQINLHKTVDEVCLVAVTKYGDYEDVKLMYELGHRDFGENRIEELEKKQACAKALGHDDIRWHFIGNIQSSKIKRITSVENLFAIHSIESLKHLKKIDESLKTYIKKFIQVNTSGEPQKNGITSQEELVSVLDYCRVNGSCIDGLMTMGPTSPKNEVEVDLCMKRLCSLKSSALDRDEVQLSLSMGMSNDYICALKNGANYLRIGSIIFK